MNFSSIIYSNLRIIYVISWNINNSSKKEIQNCCFPKLLQMSIKYTITTLLLITKCMEYTSPAVLGRRDCQAWILMHQTELIISEAYVLCTSETPTAKKDKTSTKERNQESLPMTKPIHSFIFWGLDWFQLGLNSQQVVASKWQTAGSSVLKTGRQEVDHHVYHLIDFVVQCVQRWLAWEPKALHHFNWVSIDVNCHLVHKQFVNTVHREKTKPVDTKSCKWTWKENRF